jgi:hypothetical protein
MEFASTLMVLKTASKDTKIFFVFHRVVAETPEEVNVFAQVRSAASNDGDSTVDVSHRSTFTPEIFDHLFHGNFVDPRRTDEGKEEICAWSHQAHDILEGKRGRCERRPLVYECELNDRPSLGFYSRNERRVLAVRSSLHVLRKLEQSFPAQPSRHKKRAQLASSHFHGDCPELLVVEVQTVAQAMACLDEYGIYLDDDEIETVAGYSGQQ